MKAELTGTVPPLAGNTNFEDGIFDLDGMTPMGAGLQEPSTICCPFVNGKLIVLQKLMKLLVDVNDAT